MMPVPNDMTVAKGVNKKALRLFEDHSDQNCRFQNLVYTRGVELMALELICPAMPSLVASIKLLL